MTKTAELEAAKCPSCGADLQVSPGADTARCKFCQKDVLVRRGGGKARSQAERSAAKTDNRMLLAEAAAEAGNQQEAYDYYTKVLEADPSNYKAWFGKAVAAGWGSGLNADRFNELTAGIDRAITCAPDEEKAALMDRAATEINDITTAYFKLSLDYTAEYISLDNTWDEHVERCIPMLSALGIANALDAKNKDVIENAIHLAKGMIEGVEYRDEFDTDDNGHAITKTKHLPESVEVEVKKVMNEFVGKLQALDPTYQAPEIHKAGEITAGAVVGCLVLLVLLALGAMWLIGKYVRSTSISPSPSESATVVSQAETPAPIATPVVTATASAKAPAKLPAKPTVPAKAPKPASAGSCQCKDMSRDDACAWHVCHPR